MNLGRPSSVPVSEDESIPLPASYDVYDSNSMYEHTTNDPSHLAFFSASVKLYQIAQHILLSFYSGEEETPSKGYETYFEGKTSVLQYERELSHWYDTIPTCLRHENVTIAVEDHNSQGRVLRRQALDLQLRYVRHIV
jgi:hypothetical protein